MALFQYQARTIQGELKSGQVDAPNMELAISALQRRSLVILSLTPADEALPWYKRDIFGLGGGVKLRDIVILSRQMATLFEARVPVVDSLKVLSNETLKPKLKKALNEVSQDIQGGLSITQAMAKHPDIFSDFYINMVRSGEESGKLEEIFSYLADYLERSYELVSKARNALIYPIFVLIVFIAVLALVMVFIIPQVSKILIESGADIPIYTRIIMGSSDFLRSYGIILLMLIVLAGIFLWRYSKTEKGSMAIARFTLETPIVGEIFRKFYVARLTDNLETLIVGGVTVLRALELSSNIVGNALFREIIKEAENAVRGGVPISEAFGKYKDMPLLVVQMIKIGEETGKLDFMLKTLAHFYRKEVENTVDNLVGLIEPVMIIFLGLGVALLVVSVLMPIYNISAVL